MPELLTIRDIAHRLGVPVHRVRYAIDRDGIKPKQRAGIVRLWSPDDVPAIENAVSHPAADADHNEEGIAS